MSSRILKLFGAQLMMTGLMVGLLQTAHAQRDSVLYEDNELTINDAIVRNAGTTHYFKEVRLTMTQNGDFKVVDSVEKQLAYINELSVAVSFTDPAEVELGVVGYKSTPCVELDIAVTRKNSTFYVAVGETPLQTLVACVQVIEPFEITFPLDVKGLPLGDYLVVVNGDEIDFTLE
ncbi:hypothetical protein [Pseudohongiella spirulinae]|uniref:Uncharacterized protein n=1 Tax=Pseudohongiella spirulinae TaxID=1249552 RepID=A0A0S2KCC0_9GAMM|nr:hypothetical protein [Pseudohongiella spirulinae]ALO45748.1 hypothetical protein PS2015_1085 [Pseudohongiella spirulinae]